MAMSNAERQAAFRARQQEKQQIPEHLITQMNRCLEAQIDWYNDKTNNAKIEQIMHDRNMTLAILLAGCIKELDPEGRTAQLTKILDKIDLS